MLRKPIINARPPARPPTFVILITRFFLRKTWLNKNNRGQTGNLLHVYQNQSHRVYHKFQMKQIRSEQNRGFDIVDISFV